MDHIGIDVHKRESQIFILAEGSEIVDQWIRTEPSGSRPCSAPGLTPGS
jgi:hypothetical protein